MAFSRRREMVFVYTVTDANPNGDPLNANHPRFDEETEQVLVSDVRIKRTVRDQWIRDGRMVFIDGEPKTLKDRFEELKKETQKTGARDVMAKCIDSRLFGVTFALGNDAFAWTGPVQFKWGRSLHAVTVNFVQGTSAFATEGRRGEDKQQRSFRNEYKVPFAAVCVYGIANQFASERTGATEEDLDVLRETLWQGTNNLITRSKNEHTSAFYLEVTYRPGFIGKIGALDDKIKIVGINSEELTREQGRSLRSMAECKLDITDLVSGITSHAQDIQNIVLRTGGGVVVDGLQVLKGLKIAIQEIQG